MYFLPLSIPGNYAPSLSLAVPLGSSLQGIVDSLLLLTSSWKQRHFLKARIEIKMKDKATVTSRNGRSRIVHGK
jgi:hypothetical protein